MEPGRGLFGVHNLSQLEPLVGLIRISHCSGQTCSSFLCGGAAVREDESRRTRFRWHTDENQGHRRTAQRTLVSPAGAADTSCPVELS